MLNRTLDVKTDSTAASDAPMGHTERLAETSRLPGWLAPVTRMVDPCRVVRVSESDYFEWRGRASSERAIRHAWLFRQISTPSPWPTGTR